MEIGRGGAYVPARVPCKGASISKYTNMFWCEQTLFMNRNAAFVDVDVSFADGNGSFADVDVSFADGNGSFAGEDVPFMDGNAATRTFGRAHRRRPYHFSYGSCHKIARE